MSEFDFGPFLAIWILFSLALAVFAVVCWWKIFEKAGQPGWAAIVPIYNAVIILKIIDKPLWWLVLLIIPFVNIIFIVLLYIELAKKFGKDTGFAVGLILLGIVFLPMLAFGDAKYEGEVPAATV